ncbi:type 1 glutamine amidotransferase [Shimia thalassica]|uniref:type 1 glutamine amidotransferase n=1 Tax=Shimia thalassica TaxID=1715693 RepID=UPI001C089E5F|nr:type 1 glutamine amidotransferase [Shimia thalassica]MBU2943954.1 type 1 glutamine amidotransferase [Shimia thalassica]MDO6503465.1 type 1 glutamine amidotransferase [Shimia thalassica]
MKIGILQTGHAPDELKPLLGDYADMFQDLLHEQGFEYEVHNVVDNEFPASAVDADGWLITGSKHGAYEDHDWIPPLEDLIRAIVESGRPLIGVCFGHQIIAQALGGKVEKYKGGWAVGRQTYDFGGVDMAFNAWHQDQVVERPEGTIVLASNDFCENAVLLYGDRVLTIQPHPEFDAPMIDGLINTRGKGVVPDDLLQKATEHLLEDVDNETFADQMADFFRRERS